MVDKKADAPQCSNCNASPEDIFIREVSEEVRLSKIREWWNENGNFMISLALAILLGVSIRQVLNVHKNNVKQTERALFESTPKDIKTLQTFSKNFKYGYASVAQAELIEGLLADKKYEEVLNVFKDIQKSAPQDFARELALLKQAYLETSMSNSQVIELCDKLISGKYFKDLGQELKLSSLTDKAAQNKLADDIVKDANAPKYLKKIASLYLLK